METSRREFVIGAAATGAAAMAAAAVSSGSALAAESAQTAEEQGAADGPVDGVYVTRVMGHEDWINVSTTLREGRIAACEVLNHEETMGVGNYAVARIPALIVENQSVDVPNVRGCSTTSQAIKDAVAAAIEEAGYDLEAFSTHVPRTVESGEQTIDADVVVVGAGTAGLMTAARLVSKGIKTVVIEKKDIPGGTMPLTYSTVNTAGSERQRAWDQTGALAQSSFNYSLENILAYYGSQIDESKDVYDKQAPFAMKIYGASGDAVDWMSSIGIGFMSLGSFEGGIQGYGSNVFAPGVYEGGAGYAAMSLAKYIQDNENGQIVYNAAVYELLQDESGKYVGVKARTFDAEEGSVEYTVNARCVALTAGGFARNADMVAQYYPQYAGQFFNCASGSTGEVMQLGIEAGAGVECMGRDLPAYPAAYYSKFELAFITYYTPGFMVNVNGDKCCNPNVHNHATMARIKVDPANEDTFYWIFDDAAAEKTKHYVAGGFDGYKALFHREMDAQHFDSVEEAAEELGLADLAQTLEQNNEEALAGETDSFGYASPYVETRTGLWAVRIDPNFYLTTGGLMSDTDFHVLREDRSVIDGLYAAGDTCASPEEKDGKNYGEGFSMALFSGYVLAETISSEL